MQQNAAGLSPDCVNSPISSTRTRTCPPPRNAEVIVLPARGTTAEMFAEIDMIAGQISATASSAGSPAGHYSAARDFGPVRYRAVAIPARDENTEG
jgi:hypothetical protein